MHKFTAGAEWRNEELKHKDLKKGKADITHKAVFLQDEWSITDTLTATMGARLDKHEIFGNHTSPRIYLVWQPTTEWTVKGGFGKGFRAPTIKQISPEYRFVGPHTFQGNPDLKPEISKSWEISASYHPENYGISITLFNNKIDDLIATKCIANCNKTRGRVNEYVNINSARIYGVETNLYFYPSEQWHLNLNHTWMDTEDRSTKQQLPERPRNRVNFKVSWLPQFIINDFEAFIRVEHIGKQVTYSTTKTLSLPDYTLLHAGVSFPIHKNFFVKAGVENITNKRLEKKSSNFGYEERGRFIYTGIDWRF